MRRWSILESFDARSSSVRAVLVCVGASLLVAAVGLATPVPLVVGIVLVVLLTGLAALSPLGSLLSVIVALPYFYRPIGIGTLEFAASEILLVSASLGTLIHFAVDIALRRISPEALVAYTREVARSRLVQLLVVLVAAGTIIAIWPFDPSARGATLRELRWSFLEPLVLVSLMIVIARSSLSRALLAVSLIAAGVLVAAHGLLDLATGSGVTADNVRRLSGPLPHPNALALFLVRPFVLAVALFALLRRWRPLLVVPVGLTGLALFGTFSRGAMIAVIVAAALVALSAHRQQKVVMGIGLASAAGLAMVVAGDRMRNLFEGGSVSLRLDIWSSAIAMIRDRPVLGYGPDQFLYAYAPRYIQPTAWDERFTSHAHNLIADSWIRIGIVGAVAALFALGCIVIRLSWSMKRGKTTGVMSHAAFVALVALLVHGMIDNAVFGHDLAMSAWLLAWLAFTPSEDVDERRRINE